MVNSLNCGKVDQRGGGVMAIPGFHSAQPRSRPFEPRQSCLIAILTVALIHLHAFAGNPAHVADLPIDRTQTVLHEGTQRTYHIHLPPDFNKNTPAPLVLALHGGGGTGAGFNEMTTDGTFTASSDKRGMVVVFPEGIENHWCDGRSEIVREGTPCNDVGFISTIIDTMVMNYGIDPARVYSTGISNGGFMSFRLAMDLSEKITAVAPVAAQIAVAIKGKTPLLPVSLMLINGTKDPLVPFNGGTVRLFRFGRSRGEVLSTAASIEQFRRSNGCGAIPEKGKLEDRDPDDGTTVEVERYSGGKKGSEVVLVKVNGGGHTWPGGKKYLGPALVGRVCRDFNASEMILDFFLRHSRNERPVR